MTSEEKAIAIIKKMLEFANKDLPVTIAEDWKSKFGATVMIGDSHTHIGNWDPDGTFEKFLDDLYNCLHNGPCLSFVNDNPDNKKCTICNDPNCDNPGGKH